MTRLFVAAWPPDEVRGRLLDLDIIEPADGERRIPPESWHVTLRFIGAADVDTVARRLRGAELPIATATLGPAIVTLGARSAVVPVAGVEPLAAAVRSATAGIGRREDRPFVGHLTVARVRRGATSTLCGTTIASSFTIGEITLVRSDLDADGADYTTVDRFPTVA